MEKTRKERYDEWVERVCRFVEVMIKTKNVFRTMLLAVIVGMGFTACSDDDFAPELVPAEGSEAFFEKGISFTFGGGEAVVAFTTNTSWEAKVAQEGEGKDAWCWLSAGSGEAGEASFSVRAEENEGEERKASIVVMVDGAERVIPVTQTGNGTVVLHVERAGDLPSLIGEKVKVDLGTI